MATKIGPYWCPGHQGAKDFETFARWQPRVIRELNPDAQRSKAVLQRVPSTLYCLRWHEITEAHDEMRADPVGTARRHVEYLCEKLAQWHDWNQATPLSQVLVSGINEPNVNYHPEKGGNPENIRITVAYNVALLDGLRAYGIRATALNLSVGWPDNDGTDMPPRWDMFEPVIDAIRRGNHVLAVHEYWSKDGPQVNWGWWAGRYTKIPYDVPILIGECGLDQYVAEGAIAQQRRGWQHYFQGNPRGYLDQIRWYDDRLLRDRRVIGALVYLHDFYNNMWASFNIQPIQDDIAGYAEYMRTVPEPPNEWSPPVSQVIDHPSKHYSSRLGNRVKWIVVHSTETRVDGTPQGTLAYLTENDRGVSAHELVLPGPTVYRMVPDIWAAHHAESGSVRWPDGTVWNLSNEVSWGIEGYQVVGQSVAPAIAAKMVERVAEACKRFGLKSDRVLAHREIDPSRRADPRGVDMNWFRRAVAEILGEILPDALRNLLLAEGERRLVMPLNPNAALQRKILADGFVPNSPEFKVTFEGREYVAQRAERLGDGRVRVYFAVTGDWGNVRYVER